MCKMRNWKREKQNLELNQQLNWKNFFIFNYSSLRNWILGKAENNSISLPMYLYLFLFFILFLFLDFIR